MKTTKIGSIFLISILALAGIGVGYASWIDTITIDGTVTTGSVDLVVVGYSGTWVWKVYGGSQPPVDEIYTVHGFDKPTDAELAILFPGSTIELISYAVATQTVDDASGELVDDAVTITFDKLFPCITFEADILFHYVGSIPVKISATTIDFHEDTSDPEMTWPLWILGETTKDELVRTGAWIDWYWSNADGDRVTLIEGYPIGFQLHNCDYILAVGGIHLPQDNDLMGKSSSFTATFDVIQWNKYP